MKPIGVWYDDHQAPVRWALRPSPLCPSGNALHTCADGEHGADGARVTINRCPHARRLSRVLKEGAFVHTMQCAHDECAHGDDDGID